MGSTFNHMFSFLFPIYNWGIWNAESTCVQWWSTVYVLYCSPTTPTLLERLLKVGLFRCPDDVVPSEHFADGCTSWDSPPSSRYLGGEKRIFSRRAQASTIHPLSLRTLIKGWSADKINCLMRLQEVGLIPFFGITDFNPELAKSVLGINLTIFGTFVSHINPCSGYEIG